MNQIKKFENFQNVLNELNNFHGIHGVTLLPKDKKLSKKRLFFNLWLILAVIAHAALFLLASTKKFSTNHRVERSLNLIYGCAVIFICVFEGLYLIRKKKILEFVDWCQWAETHQPQSFTKPKLWFYPQQKKILTIIR